MDFHFLKYLSLKISLALLASNAFGQMDFRNVERCIKGSYPREDLEQYRDIFIVKFGFCNGSRYCRGDLYRYINKVSKGKTLIVTADTTQEIIRQLCAQRNMVVRCISNQAIEMYSGFSAYNIHINKRRKVKRLI